MTTLRREAIKKIQPLLLEKYYSNNGNPLEESQIRHAEIFCEKIVDTLSELRGFSFLRTDEEQPAYGFDLEEADIAWTIAANKPVTQKQVGKQKEFLDLEVLIDEQLARLRMNWRQHDEKEKERFRKFLKDERKQKRELSKFVDWWMSDEWRVANPPWKLATIREQWMKAFVKIESPIRPEYQKFVAPTEQGFIPNPKGKK